ncbi:MAG: hypothetical protein DRI34_13010 [Deltaproteobacteria bacterium]|nr:MAG: hypothetical protein DRI34_13010 [Deltaproteobacteria bacterium]
MKRLLMLAGCLAVVLGVRPAGADDFAARWAKLAKNPSKVFKVTAKPGEEIPEATLNISFGPGSLISVSRGRRAKPKDMLGDDDIAGVVNRNLRVVKYCYCKALKKDPDFEGQAIVGLKIKTSGKVARVNIEPEDMARNPFGRCLSKRVARWRFPRFTGQKEDGLRVDSVGYEFPLSFEPAR